MNMSELLATEVKSTAMLIQEDPYLKNVLMLGGSRFMNKMHPEVIPLYDNTDWDFYCMESLKIREALDNFSGMYLVQPASDNRVRYPYDDLAIDIYQSLDHSCQVIVRSDIHKYYSVMSRMDPEFYRDFLWKSGPNKPERNQIQRIFNQLFKMVS